MKFGGTSMGSAERITASAVLCAQQHKQRATVIVVSAMSKITDLLLDSMKKAEAGDEAGLDRNLAELLRRHQEACRGLLPAERQEHAMLGIRGLIAEFTRIVRGMMLLGHRPPQSADAAVATGERLSAFLMAEHLNALGISAADVNARDVIATDAEFTNASPLMEETRIRCERTLTPLIEKKVLPVVTGFNASTIDGRPTTLGRGGSDFSASILAASLDAAELWIWSDVDGIMSGDPRVVADAKVLPEITYAEAAELAYNGAKVLHPRTLAPLAERQIPVWSKNSFAPEKPGTRIVPSIQNPRGVHAVTSMADVALISIEPASAEISGTRIMARSIEALERSGIELLAITSSSYRQSFCFVVKKAELAQAQQFLETDLALELGHGYLKPIQVNTDVGLVAVVGEGMRGTPGLAGRIFTAISRENVNIIAIAQGSSELTIVVVVNKAGVEQAVRAIHEECGLGK
jgi:aspartate kinase